MQARNMRSQIISALALSTMLIAQAGAGLAHMLMERGSSLSQGIDFDGDNYATWRDVTIALHQHLDRTGRLDSLRAIDGSLSHNPSLQIYLDIRAILCASMGDANGDGVIDAQDLAIIADAIANNQYLLAADTNLDGAVTTADLQHAIEQANRFAGAPIDFAQHSIDDIACHLMYLASSLDRNPDYQEELSAAGVELPLAQNGMVAAGHSDANWPLWYNSARCISTHQNDHIHAISRWYPDDHQPPVSGYPANHRWEISSRTQWPDPYPEYWPANHYGFFSGNWTPRSHMTGISSYEHQQAASSIWRPGHGVAASISWTQPPGGRSHRAHVSAVWPGNHYREMSTVLEWPYTEPVHAHNPEISAEWRAENHKQRVSNMWPPSHALLASEDRGNHDQWLSVIWPSNHLAPVSSRWPRKTFPRDWPPNHIVETSNQDLSQPAPLPSPPGWLPEDHDFLTSITTIKQLIPFFGVYEEDDDDDD